MRQLSVRRNLGCRRSPFWVRARCVCYIIPRNPDYFLPGVPRLDRVIIRIIPEFTTSVAALESGAVDAVFDLPPEHIEKLAKSSVSHVEEVQAGRWQGIIWNCEMKPFDDPRVRRAFNKLIDN